MPAKPPLPITDAALLVVDVQRSFEADSDRWQRRNNPGFEARTRELVDAFRAAERPVVWILHSDADRYFEEGSEWVRVMAFLDPRASEPVVFKTTRNAFTSTDLQPRLEAMGVRRLAICGIQTEQCCETTARVAGDLGYDVDFVTEATLRFATSSTAPSSTSNRPRRSYGRRSSRCATASRASRRSRRSAPSCGRRCHPPCDPRGASRCRGARPRGAAPGLRRGAAARRHLSRLFRERTGVSVHDYVTRVRLEHARTLLGDPALTLEALAARCGFDDARQLRRLWRAAHGVPPSVSRRRG